MGKIPKITCIICGMNVYLRNLKRRHKIQAFIVHFVKGFRGRIEYKPAETKGASLIDFWIHHLEEVIIWLKEEKLKLEIRSLVLKPISSPVLLVSVSRPTVVLKSQSPATLILDVPSKRLTVS